MTLEKGGALSLLALAAGVILLYFLRARSERYPVSALFLWEGLRSDAHSRAAWIRRKIDPLLIMQLFVLSFVVFALAEPAWRALRPQLSGMAIIIDGSASMHTVAEGKQTRYDLALKEGLALLNLYPTTPVTILKLSSSPQVIAPFMEDHDEARRAFIESRPTWFAHGSWDDLQALLKSQGGPGNFEKIVLLTDQPLAQRLVGMEQVLFTQGENLAITCFSVREDPEQQGVTALVTVQNNTSSAQERTITVSDGSDRVLLSAFLPPGKAQTYVLPFPRSHGPTFTATIEPTDAFPSDDIRYFALKRSLERRVRWIGQENRYLLAALTATWPITLVPPEDQDPVDLTIAYDTLLPAHTAGNILLFHAGLEGLVTIQEEKEGKPPVSVRRDDPLLKDVDPTDFRILSSPEVTLSPQGIVVLTCNDEPFLWRLDEQGRSIVLVAADLMQTNLPLTVDFPLLVRNIVETFAPLPSPLLYTWSIVGDPVDLSQYGKLLSLEDPNHEMIPLPQDAHSFIPKAPGIYTVNTDEGLYSIATNIDPRESTPSSVVSDTETAMPANEQASVLLPLWPYIAIVGFLMLVAETLFYHGGGVWRRRWR